jgi:hypothetical protein
MDERKAREITRLHRIDLHAQLHVMRGKERGHRLWMIRGARIEKIAKAKLEEIILGGAPRRR